MVLKLTFLTCGVCGRLIDGATVIDDDEDAEPAYAWAGHYSLPKRRYRRMIAPDLCDHCWLEHQKQMNNRRGRRGHYHIPPFHAVYLWQWVADRLREEAERYGREERRLRPHHAKLAEKGLQRLVGR